MKACCGVSRISKLRLLWGLTSLYHAINSSLVLNKTLLFWYKSKNFSILPLLCGCFILHKICFIPFAARVHYKFEKIHPFGDGNGRVGRLIIAYLLRKGNYPLLIIEYKKRKSYYHALSKSENDFLNWFFRSYVSAHKKYLKWYKSYKNISFFVLIF